MSKRSSILSLLSRYIPESALDQKNCQRCIQFVQDNPNCFERSLTTGHITGSVWLLDPDGERVLFTHHRKLNKWLQLGGHADGDSDVLRVALREATEESGLPRIRPLSSEIFDLDIHPIPAKGNEPEHFHYDIRFLAQALAPAEIVVSEESNELRWFDLEEIGKDIKDESLLRMCRRWERCKTNSSSFDQGPFY